MTLEEIEEERKKYRGRITIPEADWLIAEVKRLRESLRNESKQLRAEMQAVEDFVHPNWSNDMRWCDEIIIAIQNEEWKR